MKRYWKLLAIAFITVLVIGTFYIQKSTASNSYPQFVITKVSGNENEVKNVVIPGDYSLDGYMPNDFQMNEKGTNYVSDMSFIERQAGWHLPTEIKRLQKEYRNFMRGKQEEVSLFYEDQSVLAYAIIPWNYSTQINGEISFDIEIYDKESGKVTKINEVLPQNQKYNYASIYDVQIFNGKLKVVASVDLNGEEMNTTEIHLYTFDLKTQSLIGDNIIQAMERQNSDDISTNISVLIDHENINQQKYVLFEKQTFKEVPYEDGFTSEVISRELALYNLETNKQEKITLPEELLGRSIEGAILTDSTIYFYNVTDSKLEIIPYQIEGNKIGTKQSFDIGTDEHSTPIIEIKNNRLFILSPFKDHDTNGTIMITDVNTGNILYEGTIEAENASKLKKGYRLDFYSLEIE